MNIVIIVMLLGSLGFILLGALLLNNKYAKCKNIEDKSLINEIKSMKISGYVNIAIGSIGVISTLICLLNASLMRIVVIIFAILIAVLSLTQYILSKKYK